MTILPSSPTIMGFTANNLRGSVRYLRCPLAAAFAPDRTQLRGNGLLDGTLGGRRGVRGGSHGSACFETGPAACQMAGSCIASADGSDRDGHGVLPDGSLAALQRMVRRMPGGLPDGLRISFRSETGPAACPTACSCRFGGSALRRMVRFKTGPAAGLAAQFAATAHSTTTSQVRSGKEYAHARTSQGGHGSKPGATRPGRSNNMPNISPHRVILSGPVGERFYRPIREREDIGSMTSLLVSRI